MEPYIGILLTIILGIIGFFLMKFYNTVEDIKKGVNEILINSAMRDENIKDIKNDIHEITLQLVSMERRLREAELQIATIKA